MGELESTPGPFYSSLMAVERARWVAGQWGSRAAINGAPAILARRGAASASRAGRCDGSAAAQGGGRCTRGGAR